MFTGWTRLSVTSIDSRDRKSSFANYGYNVEISAPGENIYGPAPELQAAAWTGTSMAAPVVSGMLALALAEDSDLKAYDIAKLVMLQSSDLYDHNDNKNYKYQLGSGRVDVAALMKALLEE
jgi:subtilisin family serine protease